MAETAFYLSGVTTEEAAGVKGSAGKGNGVQFKFIGIKLQGKAGFLPRKDSISQIGSLAGNHRNSPGSQDVGCSFQVKRNLNLRYIISPEIGLGLFVGLDSNGNGDGSGLAYCLLGSDADTVQLVIKGIDKGQLSLGQLALVVKDFICFLPADLIAGNAGLLRTGEIED